MDLRAAASGPLAARLSPRYLEEHCLIPLAIDADGALTAAAGRPLDATVVDELARLFDRPVRLVDAPAAEIHAALLAARPVTPAATDVAIAAPDEGNGAVALGDLRALANQAPVIQFVNVMLLDALRAGASDVHVESTPDGVRVRVRLDGVLREVSTLGRSYQSGVISRIKLLAGLDIAERRLPQDGRARIALADRDVDLRVSTLPALHGESVVLRLLDHGARARALAELGMPADLATRFERLIRRPTGLVLVTGPTGSGKTTTLYAALGVINAPGVKILTVEDPVEYRLAGVTQIPVNRKAGLGFANALRSMLRHDPDIIMVGEMRDRETAEIAIQSALTGHLVFSTLHTNDAPGGVTRLVDMGIEPYLVAATVQAILAQRLLRLVCEACAEPYAPARAELATAPAASSGSAPAAWRRGRGCTTCSRSGYRGRTGIYELFVPSEKVRARIAQGATLDELRSLARGEGLVTLHDAAWALARSGRTSIEEVLRVASEGDL
jgi:type II secretory ATPase GspE/PulE/Tfp pilus assembly ATPase PilB-like protein